MTPAIGLLTPVKAALGAWVVDWHAQVDATTPALAEWTQRAPKLACMWAPGRMVDSAEEMLSSYRNNDNSGQAGTSARLPILLLAVSSEYTESPSETGRQAVEPVNFSFPEDSLHRVYRVRTMGLDLRAQVVVICTEPDSAMSMTAQLAMWAVSRRRLFAPYTFCGFTTQWPVQVVPGDRMAVPNPIGEQVTVLAMDFTVRATVPLFSKPRDGEDNDGNPQDPGYPVVTEVTVTQNAMGRPSWVSEEEWAAFLRTNPVYGADESRIVLQDLRA